MADAYKIGDRVSLDILMQDGTTESVEFVILDRAPATRETWTDETTRYGTRRRVTRAETAPGPGTGQRWWLQLASTGELLHDAVRESRMRLARSFGPEPLTNDETEALESAA